ncbi:MAG: CBS domain-containing protein [Chitinophagaceae bacterium]
MKKVIDILQRKGSNLISIVPETTVIEALGLMAAKNIGSVLVMRGNEYCGLLTERDYARKVILKGKHSSDTLVEEIMSKGLPRITPNDTIEVCMHLMSENNIRYLPVFENEHICGIISINDVVKETILSQEETISQLKDYLHASM